jgi:chemotaxis protein methyltransferase CheR
LALPSELGPRLGVHEFRLISDFIGGHCGLVLGSELRFVVERKLRDRVQDLSLASFADYYHHLRYHPDRQAEVERAIDLLTTNETYFFRERGQLRAFVSEVLPKLKERAAARKRLAIWSAGCSTGEEAYTLAIKVVRSGLFDGWDVRIFGNDISRRVLQVARRGVYGPSSFRAMPPEYREHFIETPDGMMVDGKIRALCQFGHFNLLDADRAAMVGRVDAIFCRNVLIYFNDSTRRRVIESFYERLYPGGHLMLGHSESLLNASTAFELAHLSGDLAYRKPVEPTRGTKS